ncbi:hypothetical protein [Chitinivibrio alkaliphilus]|uniref:hypothetical protein n=1 Tax=Chitinivibrio alkaliphilus TaxID=1505232 RepID=UPI0012DDB64B|nr:hypothetical protein [Chitinivibrio alkaliphilus]
MLSMHDHSLPDTSNLLKYLVDPKQWRVVHALGGIRMGVQELREPQLCGMGRSRK